MPFKLIFIYFILILGGSLKLSLGFTTLSPPEVIALRNHPLLLNCSGYSEEGPLQISWRFQVSRKYSVISGLTLSCSEKQDFFTFTASKKKSVVNMKIKKN